MEEEQPEGCNAAVHWGEAMPEPGPSEPTEPETPEIVLGDLGVINAKDDLLVKRHVLGAFKIV